MSLTLSSAGGKWAAMLSLPVFLCVGMQTAFAFDIPPNDGFVTDAAGLLNAQQKQALDASLQAYQDSTSNQIAVVILPSLNGASLEETSLEIARKWGIGTKAHDNGILMLIVYDSHDIRFEVGTGLEGAVPDIVAGGIIETDVTPAFRNGDYYGGIAAAIDSLKKHIGGEYTADRYAAQNDNVGGLIQFFFFLGIVGFQLLVAVLGRTKSWWLGGVLGGIGGVILAAIYGWWLSIPALVLFGLGFDFVVSKYYGKFRRGRGFWIGGGGFGGGTGGSGGFGGFGGGGFSGGGASGKW